MLSFQHGPNFIESVKTPNTPEYLRIYTPPKLPSQRRWRIVDEETGTVVDSYTPPKVERPKPICSYRNSWAHQMETAPKMSFLPFRGHPTHFGDHMRRLRQLVLGTGFTTPEQAARVNALDEQALLAALQN